MPARSRGRPRSPEAEQAIVQATMELLSTLGFRGMTVDAIAMRAGVSKATIYRRWETKENLVIEVFSRSPVLVARGKRDTVAHLVELQTQFAQFMQETPLGGVMAALVAERQHNPDLASAMDPLVCERRRPMKEVLARAIEKGELPQDTDIEFAIDMISAPTLQRIMVMGLPTDREFIRGVVEFVMAGLKNRKRSSPRAVKSRKGRPSG